MKLSFLINRLMRMSPQEILFRIKQKVQNKFEEKFLLFFNTHSEIITWEKTIINFNFAGFKKDYFLKQADNLCNNKIDIFTLKKFFYGETINYHKDYKSGLSAPLDKFGKTIDFYDYKRMGDIKYIWEPNRHLFLLNLAIAYKIEKDQKYLKKFEYYLSQWFDQNPFMRGVNWSSSLEVGIRLINWTFCWHIIKNFINNNLKNKWLENIYQHCWFISRNFSAYSSANNHLIGEASALFIASIALPEFKNSLRWQNKAYKILVRECESQNYKDGVNKEQAVYYQQFVIDFLLISGLIGKAFNRNFPQDYWNRIEKMIEYISAIRDYSGNIPKIGDEDDGLVIDLGQREYGVYRSILNTGACIFNRKDFSRINNPKILDTKSLFLLGIDRSIYSLSPEIEKPPVYQFPEGGYYILGTDFNTAKEQKLIFDCGPHGYLSISAHGHADALSFTLSAGGYPVFIDPGTFSYHAGKEWRNYFRNTRAHNTLTIDGLDQSIITGDFMWSKKANAKLINFKENFIVKGNHDGYTRLKDKVMHNREIKYYQENNYWEITDEILCKNEHKISLYFHLMPDCELKKSGDEYDVAFKKGICKIIPESNLIHTMHNGEEGALGWYSPGYDIIVKSATLELAKKIKGNSIIKTRFCVRFH